jgi:hypothetical protein
MSLVFDVPEEFLSSPEKFTLLALADNAWDDGSSCYPSRGLLIHKTNLSKATVDRAIRKLKDGGWIAQAGKTNMGVIEWVISVGRLYDVATPYEPARPYDRHTQSEPTNDDGILTVSTPHTQSEYQTISEPSTDTVTEEPTYIDDVAGAPDELQMEWDTFLKGWAHYFPNKRQPRPTNQTLLRKFKTRMKNTEWRGNWKTAVKTASAWTWAQNEGWFKADWLLHNDDNIFKVLDGTFDFKNKGLTEQATSGNIETNNQMDAWKNRRNK